MKPTYSLIPVVRVEIKSKNTDNPDLVKKFYDFELENKIFPAVRGGGGEQGHVVNYYSAENAEKIEKWLKEQKAVKLRPRK